jgi:hypothetical protein
MAGIGGEGKGDFGGRGQGSGNRDQGSGAAGKPQTLGKNELGLKFETGSPGDPEKMAVLLPQVATIALGEATENGYAP